MSMVIVMTLYYMVKFSMGDSVVVQILRCVLECYLMMRILSVKCLLMEWIFVVCYLEVRIFLARYFLEGNTVMRMILAKCFLEEWRYLVVRTFSVECFLLEWMVMGYHLEVWIFLARCPLEGSMVVWILVVKCFLEECRVVECLRLAFVEPLRNVSARCGRLRRGWRLNSSSVSHVSESMALLCFVMVMVVRFIPHVMLGSQILHKAAVWFE
ncbi:unnamed protein product [Prorocentrum cordatum]|uniref:Uncharacterized protein n=1 Tax=Prorocentrum cordatum TaxID=2364126 RepID=A0ABN9W3Z3_9DINO|nr:unnamed protein product [Polarella glacialis]